MMRSRAPEAAGNCASRRVPGARATGSSRDRTAGQGLPAPQPGQALRAARLSWLALPAPRERQARLPAHRKRSLFPSMADSHAYTTLHSDDRAAVAARAAFLNGISIQIKWLFEK